MERKQNTSRIHKKLDKLISIHGAFENSDWLLEHEAQELLGLKTTTLWNLRKAGKLRYSKIRKRIYYSRQSINELIKENLK